jgi:hypothetical protein
VGGGLHSVTARAGSTIGSSDGRIGARGHVRAALAGALLVVTLLALSGTAPARAATPFTIDRNPAAEQPQVGLDEKGTAHVVWNEGLAPSADLTHYCRIPRGARSCERRHALHAPGEAIGQATWVLAPGEGDVIVVSQRIGVSGGVFFSTVFAWVSHDGGQTFGPRTAISDNTNTHNIARGVVAGPGPDAVSLHSTLGPSDFAYQAAAIDGPAATQWAELGPESNPQLQVGYGTAFVDPLTPLVAGGPTAGDAVYFRRFGGGGAFNSAGSWGPPTLVARNTDNTDNRIASLRSGRRGVHMLLRQLEPRTRFFHRRYNGETFGDPTPVSDPDAGRIQDFFLDPSGRVHALWMDGLDVRHRTSGDGVRWRRSETLLANYVGGAESFRADATCDGGGLGVFNLTPMTGIQALPFGATGAVDCEAANPDCIDRVRVGQNVIAEAQEGCFEKTGGAFTSAGDVRVNGIDLRVGSGGARARAAARGRAVVIDTRDRSLRTTRRVEVRVGNVVLGREQLAWKLPRESGEIEELVGPFAGQPVTLDIGKAGSDLFGFEVLGYVAPRITGRGAGEIAPNVRLPAPFTGLLGGSATAGAPLTFNNARGLVLKGFDFALKDVSIGIADLLPCDLDHVPVATFRGKCELELPGAAGGVTIEFELEDGEFTYGRAKFTPPSPGIPIAKGVFLARIDFDIVAGRGCERPTKIGLGGRIVVLPAIVADLAMIDIDPLGGSYSLPVSNCGLPGVLQVGGEAKFLSEVKVGSANVTFKTSGQLTFGVSAGLTTDDPCEIGFQYNVQGGISVSPVAFYAQGSAGPKACDWNPKIAEAIVSNKGLGTCFPAVLPTPPFFVGFAGLSYRWGSDLDDLDLDWPPLCDLDLEALKPVEFQRAAAARSRPRAAGAAQIRVPRGTRSLVVELKGEQGAPGFVLTGPGGLRIEHTGGAAPPVANDSYSVYPAAPVALTNLRLRSPRPGAYSVSDVPGVSQITGVSYARELPKPNVKGKVRGRGHKRVLIFKARKIEGQVLRFVEEGKGGVKAPIGMTKKAKGKLRFKPSPGPSGKRRVLAIVEQGGTPRAQLRVASYRAPNALLPGKVRGLKLKRKGGKLAIDWRKAPRAKRYAVAWKLRDGRRGAVIVNKTKFVLGKVPRVNGGAISVAGLRADNVAGKVARAKLKTKPKRKQRGNRDRRPRRPRS